MQILSLDDIRARGIRLSRTTLWRLERDGQFPQRIQVSPGRIGWVAARSIATSSSVFKATELPAAVPLPKLGAVR